MAHILVVDDDEDIREAVACCLESEGHLVTKARQGAEALEQLARARQRVQVVITDLNMPVCDGRAFLQRLDELPATRDIPRFLLSAEDHPTGIRATILRKPFDLERLLAAVTAVL